MSTIVIKYNRLEEASKALRRYAVNVERRADNLALRVTSPLGSLPGNDTKGYVGTASNCASNKINELREKARETKALATEVDNLVTSARNADDSVCSKIRSTGEAVYGKRSWLQQAGDWLYRTFCVNLVNSSTIGRAISNAVKWGRGHIINAVEDARIWFKYKEGKYVWEAIKTIGVVISAVSAAIGAVTAVVLSLPFSSFTVACAACVILIIAMINASYSLENDQKAYLMARKKKNKDGTETDGNIVMARYYGNIDSFSDWTKRTDNGGALTNTVLKGSGTVVDTVEDVCDLIMVVNTIANLFAIKGEIVNGQIKKIKTGKTVGYDFTAKNFWNNFKDTLGIKRQRYSIDSNGKKIQYNGQKSGYCVGDRWSLDRMFDFGENFFGTGATDKAFYNMESKASTLNKFKGLTNKEKVSKIFLDTGVVINKTMGKMEAIDGWSSNLGSGKPWSLDLIKNTVSTFSFIKVIDEIDSVVIDTIDALAEIGS